MVRHYKWPVLEGLDDTALIVISKRLCHEFSLRERRDRVFMLQLTDYYQKPSAAAGHNVAANDMYLDASSTGFILVLEYPPSPSSTPLI